MNTMASSPPNRDANRFSVEQFKNLYQPFSAENLTKLHLVYSDTIIFKDPVKRLQGIDQLSAYFHSFCTPEVSCRFEFIDEIMGNDQAFFKWHMHYSHPRINGGQKLMLEGATHIKFNDRIFYHEDFYDMGAMLYQHIPVVGWLVKKINARLTGISS